MVNLNRIVILTGPTAIGKSAISIKIAQIFPDIEIISADSMQIYKYMNIGTDKPDENILKKFKHHCINLVEPTADYDVSQYIKQAENSIADILQRNKKPLIVGGTGLYLKSLINPIFTGPGRNQKIRNELFRLAIEKGNLFLYEKLKEYDPEYALKLSSNDLKRIIRALEVFQLTGKPLSCFHQQAKNSSYKSNYQYFILGIFSSRENLYQRINNRVDEIIARGLIDEVRELWQKYNGNCNSFLGIGYRQIIKYLQGQSTEEEAIDKIKIDSRRFAKRQMSWFKNQLKIDCWINTDEYADINGCVDVIVKIMKEEGY
ncbi:MAG TPA: tRNA (adenosine(37)-N6)-dimethylallyltransferase MiaA [Atribacterota bacterium]|nr:tRNA (adenosine(37)-N6)-dimethylallyltransferase MiaA [Atribacterota bacterium]